MNIDRRSGKQIAMGTIRRWFVDTHAHYYPCFDVENYLSAAIQNARQHGNANVVLMLADNQGQDSIATICQRLEERDSRFRLLTSNSHSTLISDHTKRTIWLMRGQQVRTSEGLEILVYGNDSGIPSGRTFASSLQIAAESARLTIVPWSFGKWWGKRGRLVCNTMHQTVSRMPDSSTSQLALGDNGCRPSFIRAFGYLESMAERIDDRLRILPGSDPLPYAREARRAASYGALVESTLQESIDPIFDALQGEFRVSGSCVSFTQFLRQQWTMNVGRSPNSLSRQINTEICP